MYSLRKWLYKPKKTDTSLLAQFYHSDEELYLVASELDSFDGRRDPERCAMLVNELRFWQDAVLNTIEKVMDNAIPDQRASRDFRVKFPDDILHESLAGQLWFGAECLAAGSIIMNREVESASMRPLARALTKNLDSLRAILRDQCLRNINFYGDKVKDALVVFDKLLAEFELSYVSSMVSVKTMKDYDLMQDVIVLFSETLTRALKMGLVSATSVDDCDPSLMLTIPRLAIVSGLLVYPEGPLNPDNVPQNISELFRPFQNLLYKIRELLYTLSQDELCQLELLLCSNEQPVSNIANCGSTSKHSPMCKSCIDDAAALTPIASLENHIIVHTPNSAGSPVTPTEDRNNDDSRQDTSSNVSYSPSNVILNNPFFTPVDDIYSLEAALEHQCLERDIDAMSKLISSSDDCNELDNLTGIDASNSHLISSAASCDLKRSLSVGNGEGITKHVDGSRNQLTAKCSVNSFDFDSQSRSNMKTKDHCASRHQLSKPVIPPNDVSSHINRKDLVGYEMAGSCSQNSISNDINADSKTNVSDACSKIMASSKFRCNSNSFSVCVCQHSKHDSSVCNCVCQHSKNESQTPICDCMCPPSKHDTPVWGSICQQSKYDVQPRHTTDADNISICSSDTSSYNSESHDDEEITLAIQAAEIASRHEVRSHFHSSSDLIHRLFVCISGVADQLQTNYASDMRHILKSTFDINSSGPSTPQQTESKLSLNCSYPRSERISLSAAGAPLWLPDVASSTCMGCHAPFTLIRRRHHCRNCGKLFCSRCSSNSVPLQHTGHQNSVRVCIRCFIYHVTPFTLSN